MNSVLTMRTDRHGLKWYLQYDNMWASGERNTRRFGNIPHGRCIRHCSTISW